MEISLERFWDFVAAGGAILVVLTGAFAAAPALRGWYRRTTVGRRREHYRRLRRLGTNGQLTFFNAVLAQPPALRRKFVVTVTTLAGQPEDTTAATAYVTRIALFMRELERAGVFEEVEESNDADLPEAMADSTTNDGDDFQLVRTPIEIEEVIWIDRDYYVQAIVDRDSTVLAYSVTTRRPRFRPTLLGPSPPSLLERFPWARRLGFDVYPRSPLFRARLTKTPFERLGEPRAVYASLGLRRFAYAEAHWFGNPGAYQHFVFAFNDAGSGPYPDPNHIFADGGGTLRAGAWADGEEVPLETVSHFRRWSTFNTYAVIGPRFHLEDYPIGFGPDLDEVRTLS